MSACLNYIEASVLMLSSCCYQRQTRAPWPIPASGFVRICIAYQCEQAALSDISHDEGISNVIAAIRDSKTEAERMVLFDQAISSPYYYMSAQQALMLYEEVSKHVVGEIDVISELMHNILINPCDLLYFALC